MPRDFRRDGLANRDFRRVGWGFKATSSGSPPPPASTRAVTGGWSEEVSGIKFPIQFGNGRLLTSQGTRHLMQNVMQILGTAPGEYIMKPTYGSLLSSRVFDPVNVVALAKSDIETAVRTWEPRVTMREVTASLANAASGRVDLVVQIEVVDTGDRASATLQVGE